MTPNVEYTTTSSQQQCQWLVVVTSVLLFLSTVVKANYDPFSDKIHYTVNFLGPHPADDQLSNTDLGLSADDSVVVMTQENEKYKCVIPDISNTLSKEENIRVYKGPTEEELLAPLFKQSSCSYKIEPYWTYELCHQKYLRQYHEEKDAGKEVKLQEYYLGNYRKKESSQSTEAEKPPEEETAQTSEDDKTKFVQIGSQQYNYFEVILTDGTLCDLTGHPRMTSVKYICHELGRGEVYDLKEMSTCQYEVIVLTMHLCSHPAYRPHKDPVNAIKCHSMDGAPLQPVSLVNFELENSKGHYRNSEFSSDDDEEPWELELDLTIQELIDLVNQNHNPPILQQDGAQGTDPDATRRRQHSPSKAASVDTKAPVDSRSSTQGGGSGGSKAQGRPQSSTSPAASLTRSDKQLLKDFLSGDYCIQGGTGWWKHEFCYGKSVTQFHEDRAGKVVISLGVWDERAHLDYIKAHPAKRPDKDRKFVNQLYSGGDICDITKKPRVVEVKLRCKDNPNHPNSIALYLVEPRPCEYSLVVESQILCPLLLRSDADGIMDDPPL